MKNICQWQVRTVVVSGAFMFFITFGVLTAANRYSRFRNHKHRPTGNCATRNLRSKASEVPPTCLQQWAAGTLALRLQSISRVRDIVCGTRKLSSCKLVAVIAQPRGI